MKSRFTEAPGNIGTDVGKKTVGWTQVHKK